MSEQPNNPHVISYNERDLFVACPICNTANYKFHPSYFNFLCKISCSYCKSSFTVELPKNNKKSNFEEVLCSL